MVEDDTVMGKAIIRQ